MSFMLTTAQFRDQSKDVTRRMGWLRLKVGDRVMGIEKGQGLKKGEKLVQLGEIEIVDVRREPLRRMIDDIDYGFQEVAREGFKDHPQLRWPTTWVEWFAASHGCTINDEVTRIEYRYRAPIDTTVRKP